MTMSEGIITRKCLIEKPCAVFFYHQIWNKRTCLDDKPFGKCSLCPCLGCCTRMIKSWSMHKPTPIQLASLHNWLLRSTMWLLFSLVHYETEFWNHETISRNSCIPKTLESNRRALKIHMQVEWITYAIGQRRWAAENCANSSQLW